VSEKRTVVVQEIMQKSGEKDGKPWTRYAIKDANGDIYSTFKAESIAPVRDATGQKVDIEFTVNGQYKNLVSAAIHSNGSAVPETYSAQKADGDTDWDIIGLRKTRCLLWAEYLGGSLASGIYHKVSEGGQGNPGDAVIRAGITLVAAAEKDVFERAPGDPGFPF
jgi:hypothetical protein